MADGHELIAQIQDGNTESLSEFYDRYAGLVFSTALQITRSQHQAQSVLQDVFLTVWEKAETYDPSRGSLVTWLMAITRNKSIDQLRSGEKQRRSEVALSDELRGITADEGSNTPLQDVFAIERRKVIKEALQEIPEEQRNAIFLNYFQGASHAEIAAGTDTPLGTVKTRIQLGTDKLRAALRKHFGDESG